MSIHNPVVVRCLVYSNLIYTLFPLKMSCLSMFKHYLTSEHVYHHVFNVSYCINRHQLLSYLFNELIKGTFIQFPLIQTNTKGKFTISINLLCRYFLNGLPHFNAFVKHVLNNHKCDV